MKTIRILIATLFIIFAVSCTKEKNANKCLISSITINNDITHKRTIKYDNQGRITEYYVPGGSKMKITYAGLSGTLEFRDPNVDTLFNSATLLFDSQGRLISFEEYAYTIGLTRYYYTFKYNSDGYLISTEQTLSGPYDLYKRDTLIYTNGNLTQKITRLSNNSIYQTINYTYGTDKNKTWNFYWNGHTEPFSILSGYLSLYPLLGKSSANLPTSIVSTEGSFVDNFSYNYLFDSDGNVIEYNELRSNTSFTESTNYKLEYICN
ncbi:MAG: DUF4595 domain-containing protein [Chitinophagales bacterium]